jgi:RIO kinase 1
MRVQTMTRIYESARPVPPHLMTEDYLEDIEIGLVKTGKEADVYLIERVGPTRSCFLARKVYADPERRDFRNAEAYRAHARRETMRRDGGTLRSAAGGRSTRLAIEKRTRFGKQEMHREWMGNEYAVLSALWEAGASVPCPIESTDDGFLMEYIGDAEQAAPRLVNARSSKEQLTDLFRQFVEQVRLITRAGYVHGDLSPYNTLVWEDRLVVIDLPQAVPVLASLDATDLLHRDVVNMTTWFMKKGVEADPEDVFVQVLDEMFHLQMEDRFLAR